jgi:hypothetical protein
VAFATAEELAEGEEEEVGFIEVAVGDDRDVTRELDVDTGGGEMHGGIRRYPVLWALLAAVVLGALATLGWLAAT